MIRLILTIILFWPFSGFCQVIELIHHYRYINQSHQKSGKIFHRVTVPAETLYQKLVEIKSSGQPYQLKTHKNTTQQYLEVSFEIDPKSEYQNLISFVLKLDPIQYVLPDQNILIQKHEPQLKKYLISDQFSESDSRQIQSIAHLILKNNQQFDQKIFASYEFVNEYLTFQRMPERTSALSSIKNGVGDCTEFSDLFVAISRAMGIPARTVSLFNFSEKKQFKMPNHNEAEVYVEQTGWLPIYTNLGAGRYDNAYAPGLTVSDNIVYSRDNVWTWANYFTEKMPENSQKVVVDWQVMIDKNKEREDNNGGGIKIEGKH